MSIADAILTQIQQAGQPRTVKSTETVTGKEPVDIGSLGLLLYMLMQGMGKGGAGGPLGGPEAGGVFPGSELMGMGNLMPSFGAPAGPAMGAPSAGGGFGGMDPMQMIMMLLRGASGGAPGVGGF